jgi:hypothetical protein
MLTRTAMAALALSCCFAQDRVLWKDPGAVENINFDHAAGGLSQPPREPFYFLAERYGGSSPKVLVRDSASIQWRVKGGYETRSESFVTRLVAALGYYANPVWFISSGKMTGVISLKRAAGFIHTDGSFPEAAFEQRDKNLRRLSQDWLWTTNPFLRTHELNGLKIIMMLVSNWDNKDARERHEGSNTGISERDAAGRIRLIYHVTDWGQALGAWGAEPQPKGWDCSKFTAQTASFVQGRAGQYVRFGYVGRHTDDFKNDITIEDVRWLLQYLGPLSDVQLQHGLKASGATPAEVACFGAQLRERINQLRRVIN